MRGQREGMVRGGGAAGGARGSHRGSRGSRGSSGESTDKDWMDEEFQNPLGTKSRSDGSEPGASSSEHSGIGCGACGAAGHSGIGCGAPGTDDRY